MLLQSLKLSLILAAVSLSSSAALAVPIQPSQGAFTRRIDFDDLNRKATYCSGCIFAPLDPSERPNVILSGGARMTLQTIALLRIPESEPLAGFAAVISDPAGGAALELTESLLNPELAGLAIEFVSVDIAQLAQFVQLFVNGDLVEAHTLGELNGRTFKGVSFEVTASDIGAAFSRLVLRGQIDDLQFGGSHVIVDNLAYGQTEVPEPSTLLLFGAGILGGLCRRSLRGEISRERAEKAISCPLK